MVHGGCVAIRAGKDETMNVTVDTQKLFDLAQRLIGTKGLTSNEFPVSQLCAEAMRQAGFDEVHTDSLNNTVGILRGTGKGVVLFDGHIDTVGVTDESEWSVPPYEGVIKDNRIYGRGASDMRGAVAAMIRAAGEEAAGGRPEATVVVSCTTHEEVAEGFCLRQVLQWLAEERDIRPDIVIIGEASELRLNRGQRGRAALFIDAHGVAGHSSNPANGRNAITVMRPLLEAIAGKKTSSAPLLGEGSTAVTGIISRPWPAVSVIPDLCTIAIDRRLLVGETRDSVMAEFRELADEVARRHPDHMYTVRYARTHYALPDGRNIDRESFAPAWELPEDHAFVRAGLHALAEASLPGVCGHYSFCTNGSGSCGELGIPTLGFGPSRENLAHVADEYIELDQLTGACRGYRSLIRALGGACR